MKNNPKVSVIIPVLDGERFLSFALTSILEQTFQDFELIIINDGSTDKTEEIIKSFIDERIVYLNNEKNMGLAFSFNRGIDAAKGQYIARMDADDISLPERFAEQLSFLDCKPNIGIVGSQIYIMREDGEIVATHSRPESHKEIKFYSLFSSPMYHPTVMGRIEVFKSHHFNETFSNSEDYELWSRLLFQTGIKFSNIQKPLLKYRIYPQSFTQTLNLDRRALSAHNTIKNVEHYLKLTQKQKNFIIHLRQEQFIPLIEIFTGLSLYFRITLNFIEKESPGIKGVIGLWSKYLDFCYRLFKHDLKKFVLKA